MRFRKLLAGSKIGYVPGLVRRRKWVLIPLAFTAFISLALLADHCYYRSRVFPGVFLGQVALGGHLFTEAEEKLACDLWALEQVRFVLPDGQVTEITIDELGVRWNTDATMENIRRAGRGWSGYGQRVRYLLYGTPLSCEGLITVDETLAAKAIGELAGLVFQTPQDAYFSVNAETITIVPERDGRFLEVRALRERIIEAVFNNLDEVLMPLGQWPASRTKADLQSYGVDRVSVSFYTDVAAGNPDRAHNIRLGANSLNGLLLAPGEVLSFSEAIGEVSREKGYRDAPVIIGEELIPGVGGGLCQVSSTLYNVALLANLEIVERHNHSLTVAYLPLGRDAAVASGHLDLKIRNSRDHYLLIGTDLNNFRLTFNIFSLPIEEQIEIISSGQRRVPPPVRYEETAQLPAGVTELVRAGKPGYYITTWRVVYLREQEIGREMLAEDYYQPIAEIYRIGTGTD